MRLFSMCATILQTNCEYYASLQTSISSITGIQTFMYTCKLYVKFHYELSIVAMDGSWISKLGKFLLTLRTDYLGKFVPREINPLYSS